MPSRPTPEAEPELPNPYEVLGVAPSDPPDRVREAFRAACFRFHPDARGGEPDAERFQRAREAFEVLNDPSRRRELDRRLAVLPEGTPMPDPEEPPVLSAENVRRNLRFLESSVRRTWSAVVRWFDDV